MRKTCTECNESKLLAEFYKNSRMADGCLNQCKDCQKAAKRAKYATDPATRANAVWATLQSRINNANGDNPSYGGVELRVSKEEFVAWVVPRYEAFLRKYPDQSPSVDRLDEHGHYELDNMQVIALGENSRRKNSNKNVHAPRGKAWCGSCQLYLLRSAFHANAAQPHGLEHSCKQCSADRVKIRRSRLRSEQPERARAETAWENLRGKWDEPCSHADFMAWAIPAYAAFAQEYPGEVPWLVRDSRRLGYRLGNLYLRPVNSKS